jgi:uncharacterized protein YciI
MTRKGLVVLAVAVCLVVAYADEPHPEMATYQFVLMRRAPDAPPKGERAIQRIQEDRLAWLEKLFAENQAVLAGSLDGGGELRGAMVLDVGSVEAAREVMEVDPRVAAGLIDPEIHTLWAAKGVIERPDSLARQSKCMLGLFMRPDNAPDLSEEESAELQAGHLANIEAMAASGDLVWAGPTGDDGKLRGILVFRTLNGERLRELIARDPAIKIGRLGVELYPWHVPTGTLPTP